MNLVINQRVIQNEMPRSDDNLPATLAELFIHIAMESFWKKEKSDFSKSSPRI